MGAALVALVAALEADLGADFLAAGESGMSPDAGKKKCRTESAGVDVHDMFVE